MECLPAECLPAECLPAECLPVECLPAECRPVAVVLPAVAGNLLVAVVLPVVAGSLPVVLLVAVVLPVVAGSLPVVLPVVRLPVAAATALPVDRLPVATARRLADMADLPDMERLLPVDSEAGSRRRPAVSHRSTAPPLRRAPCRSRQVKPGASPGTSS